MDADHELRSAATQWLRTSHAYLVAKRVMDVTLALLLLVLLTPLMAAIALMILVDSGRPVLFVQERVGGYPRRGARSWGWQPQPFRMLKFRTMRPNAASSSLHEEFVRAFVAGKLAPPGDGLTYKLRDDPRVTRVGRWLRATSLDELPQLFNVLAGTMSLVGPRPVPPYEVAGYEARHLRRLAARPGLTGIWQVHGRGRTTFEQMVRMDVEYVERQSLWLDIRLLVWTIPTVLSRRGAA